MRRNNGFTNQRIEIPTRPQNSYLSPVPGVTGVVNSIDRKTQLAEVTTIFGDVKSNVRIPGPALSTDGKAHGRWQEIQINQLVFVGYVMGVQNSPYIIEAYPYYATNEDFNNLKAFIGRFPEIQDGEMVDFHSSGYCVRYQNGKIVFQSDSKQPKLQIDMVSGMVTVKDSLTVGHGNYKAIKTPSMKEWMGKVYATLSAMKTAIDAVTTNPGDGGAAIKAALMTALNSFPPPPTPMDIDTTNAGFGDPV